MTYSCEHLPIDEKWQDDKLESTYNSSVPKQDVALKTNQKRWSIEKGGGRGSGISMLMTRHDDDDNDEDFNFFLIVLTNPARLGISNGVRSEKNKGKMKINVIQPHTLTFRTSNIEGSYKNWIQKFEFYLMVLKKFNKLNIKFTLFPLRFSTL